MPVVSSWKKSNKLLFNWNHVDEFDWLQLNWDICWLSIVNYRPDCRVVTSWYCFPYPHASILVLTFDDVVKNEKQQVVFVHYARVECEKVTPTQQRSNSAIAFILILCRCMHHDAWINAKKCQLKKINWAHNESEIYYYLLSTPLVGR